jgi:hypothetical protein
MTKGRRLERRFGFWFAVFGLRSPFFLTRYARRDTRYGTEIPKNGKVVNDMETSEEEQELTFLAKFGKLGANERNRAGKTTSRNPTGAPRKIAGARF